MRNVILDENFFGRDTLVVAEELLGKWLVRESAGRREAWRITEVEAYDGPDDRASHASRGRTDRNAPMFGPPGRWYLYLCYGMHWMLNIVTGPVGYPAAVLIRGVDGISGPGRLTSRLKIGKSLLSLPSGAGSGLWIENRGGLSADERVERLPRVGIAYAGAWASKPYRFVLRRVTNDK